jgi:hypothetical protein
MAISVEMTALNPITNNSAHQRTWACVIGVAAAGEVQSSAGMVIATTLAPAAHAFPYVRRTAIGPGQASPELSSGRNTRIVSLTLPGMVNKILLSETILLALDEAL